MLALVDGRMEIVEDVSAAPSSSDQNQKREENLPVEGAKQKCRYRCPSKCGVLKGICHNV
jgi:hypothetical protein